MRAIIFTFLFTIFSLLSFSQAVTPFSCSATGYLFQNSPTDIFGIDLQTGNSVLLKDNLVNEATSVGYNPIDNFIYAIGKNTRNLYKIDANFNFTVYTTSLPTQIHAADISADGIMYFLSGTKLYRYDLNTNPPTPLSTITIPSTNAADISISPIDGFIYALSGKTLYKINPTTGARTTLGSVNGLGNYTYGASYFDSNGNLYASTNQNGQIMKISVDALNGVVPLDATLFSPGPVASSNDGSFCINAVVCNVGNTSPSLTGTSLTNGCGSSTVNLGSISATNPVTGTVLTWHTALPTTNANKLSNLVVSTSGTYYATFYDAEHDCYSAGNTPVTVNIVPVPTTPTLLTPTSNTLCAGQSLSLQASCSVGTPRWYVNNTSGTVVGNGTSVNVTPTSSTNYVSTCVSTSPACVGPSSSLVSVTLNPKPTAPVISAGSTQICSGNSTTLTATGCSGAVTWSNAQTGNSITVSPGSNTTYTATCTTNGCTSVNSNSVTVNVLSGSGPRISASSNVICEGDNTNLIMNNCSGVIAWLQGAINIGNTASISVGPLATTTYTATCDGNNVINCNTGNNNLIITVNAKPSALVISGTATICAGQSTNLSSTACTGGTLLWSNGQTGTPISVSPSTTTTYTANCLVNGCLSDNSNAITVTINPVPNAPSISGSQTACSGQSTDLGGSCTAGTLVFYSNQSLSTVQSMPFTPNSTQTYYATCEAAGCQSSFSQVALSVTSTPSIPSSATASPSTICSGTSTALNANCGTNTLVWYTDAGLSNALTSNVVAPLSNTTYYGACVSGLCKSAGVNVNVTVIAAPAQPTVSTSSQSICEGNAVNLTGTCSGSDVINWYAGVVDAGTLQGSGSPLSVSPLENTIYKAVCYNSGTSCSSKAAPGIAITLVAQPTAPSNPSASATTVCSGTSVTLSSSCTSGTLRWYSDAPLTSEVSSPVSPSSTTTYYAACVTGNCKSTAKSIVVNVNPTPSAPGSLAASPSTICLGVSSSLSAVCTSGSLQWFSDAGLTASVSSPVSPATTSTYYASCVSGSCKSIAASIIITVNALPASPVSIVASNNNFCEGGTSQLSATCSGVAVAEWSTDPNFGSLLAGSSPTVSPVSNTVYYVRCTENGCVSNAGSMEITVLPKPALPVISPSSRTVCTGTPVTLVAAGCNGTLSWSPPGGTANGAMYDIISITGSVNYTVTCTSGAGCSSDVSAPSVIDGVVPPVAPSISASANEICLGGSTTLISTNCTGGTVTWYEGATTNPSIGTGASLSVSPTTNTSYVATCTISTTVQDAVLCESGAADPVVITVNAVPAAPSVSASSTNICAGQTITLTATSCTGTILWSSGETGAVVNVTLLANASYSAVCIENGCTSTSSSTLNISVTDIPASPASVSATAICSGQNTVLTGTCSNPSVIAWYSDGGLSTPAVTNPSTTVTYYAVCENNGCQSLPVEVIVDVSPTPSAPTGLSFSPASFCAGSNAQLSGVCDAGELKWYSDSGLNNEISGNPFNPTVPANYYAACINGSCTGPSASILVTPDPIPVTPSLVASASTICESSDVTLTASNCSNDVVWDNGFTGLSQTISLNVTTTFTAKCVDPATNCESSPSVPLTVTVETQPLQPDALSSPAEICPGGSSTVSTSGSCSGSFTWYDSGNNNVGTGPSISVNPALSESYSVQCTTSTGCLSSLSDGASVVVKATPVITDILNSCLGTNSSLVAFQTTGGGGSTVSVPGYIAVFDADGRKDDPRAVWIIENVPNSTLLTVTVTENGCSSDQVYNTADCASLATTAYPLTLITFKGTAKTRKVNLEWTTAFEKSVSHFMVERSRDARSFEPLGKVEFKSGKSRYSFVDEKPNDGINYYILKVLDFDGSFEYSKIIAVDYKPENEIVVVLYPNPLESGKELNLEVLGNFPVKISRLFNVGGVSINHELVQTDDGKYWLNIGKLPAGIYILHLSNGQYDISKTFIVK